MMLEPIAFEIAFSHFVQSFSSPTLDAFFSAITVFGHPALWFLLAAFLYWKGDEKKSFYIASVILFASAIVGVLKEIIARPRPLALEFRIVMPESDGGNSFPSGHTAIISGIAGFYWNLFNTHHKIIAVAVIILVALSRIYLGVHYLADVIVGALFGHLIGRLVNYLDGMYEHMKVDTQKMLQKAWLGAAIVIAIAISFAFRSLGLASGLFAFFAGAAIFKLLGKNSTHLHSEQLVAKELGGFFGLAIIILAGFKTELEPEAFFLGGLWITLLYPLLYNEIVFGKRKMDSRHGKLLAKGPAAAKVD